MSAMHQKPSWLLMYRAWQPCASAITAAQAQAMNRASATRPSRNRIEKMIPGGIESWCGWMGAKHGSLAPMWHLAVLQPISFSSHPVWLRLARPQVDPMVLASWDGRPWGMLHAGDFPEPDLCPKAILSIQHFSQINMCHHFFAFHMVLFPGRGYHPGDHHICYKTFARAHHQPRKTKMKA